MLQIRALERKVEVAMHSTIESMPSYSLISRYFQANANPYRSSSQLDLMR